MSASTRVFVARLTGLAVFDPLGDQVGRVRDVVVMFSANRPAAPRHRPRRRGARPSPRLRADDAGDLDRRRRRHHDRPGQHAPLRAAHQRGARRGRALRPHRDGHRARGGRGRLRRRRSSRTSRSSRGHGATGSASRSSCARPRPASRRPPRRCRASPGAARARRCSSTSATSWGCTSSSGAQSAERLLETYDDLKVADLAEVIHDLNPKRRAEVAGGARRRAARRRPRGAARGRPGRDPRRPRQRPRRRRARGDGARRRRRPARRPAARAGRAAAPAHGARRGRARCGACSPTTRTPPAA